MSDFKEFLQYRALTRKYQFENHDLTEAALASDDSAAPLRNVCAKLSVPLAESIDDVVAHLGISKRLFIERALIDAVARANDALHEYGYFERMNEAIDLLDEARKNE